MTKEETKMITARENVVLKLAVEIEETIKEVSKVVGGLTYIEVAIAYATVDTRLIEHILEKDKSNDKTEKDS